MAEKGYLEKKIEEEIKTKISLKTMDFERARGMARERVAEVINSDLSLEEIRKIWDFVDSKFKFFLSKEDLVFCGFDLSKKEELEKEIEEINIMHEDDMREIKSHICYIEFLLTKTRKIVSILKEKQEKLNSLED